MADGGDDQKHMSPDLLPGRVSSSQPCTHVVCPSHLSHTAQAQHPSSHSYYMQMIE